MIIIEFFGPPCSGKTYICNYLKKKHKSIILSNTLIHDYAEKIISLSYIEKISLKYVFYLKYFKKNLKNKNLRVSKSINKFQINKRNLNNRYSNFMINKYLSVCKKIFFLFKKKNPLLIKFIMQEISNTKNNNRKKIYKNWFVELSAQFYIAKKLRLNKVILFDEGFIQRSLFLMNKNQIKKIKLNKYLNLSDKADYYIYMDRKSDILNKRSLARQKSEKNVFIYKNKEQVSELKLIFKNILKNLKKINNL